MNDLSYLDFDLSIEPEGRGFRARVLASPAGQAAIHFDAPPPPPEGQMLASLRTFGSQLFGAVFQGEVLSLFRRSLDEANRRHARLRILLRLGDVSDLNDLPWEYLYDPVANGFLALFGDTPVVRYVEVPQPNRPLLANPPLRILVILSNPDDYPPLDVEKEWSSLQEALADLQRRGLVIVERLDEATLANLQTRLRQQTYHVFHFIGHGNFDDQSGEGALVFEDEANRGRFVTGQDLSVLLGAEKRALVLAVLNACEAARLGRTGPFSGVAQSLVQLGIPAVVAHRSPIPDRAAALFGREFYRSLAEGLAVDVALAEGRKAIYTAGDEVAWGIPVLFLRSASDGCLFQPLDVQKVLSALQQSLPDDDPTPRHLAETLRRFQNFHACLYEWKELHNFLNDITMVTDQFCREVERLDAAGGRADPRLLSRLWRPVAQKVDVLLEWAATIRDISAPLERSAEGLKGPSWATELYGARLRIEELLHPNDFDLPALYDAAYDFTDTVQRHIYLADKSLRDTAGELYHLSQLVLGSLTHEHL